MIRPTSVIMRLCLVAILFTDVSCSSESAGPAVATVAPPSTVDGTFTPRALAQLVDRAVDAFQEFAGAADELADQVAACSHDSSAATDAWRRARLRWDAASVYRWGPGKDSNLVPSIDYWPVDPMAVAAASEGAEPMTQVEYDSLGAAARGLPAIEALLFGSGPMTGRECSYALLAAASAATTAQAAVTDFADRRSGLTVGDSSLVTALSALADGVYQVCDLQLGMPSGNTVLGGPPDLSLLRQGEGKMAAADVLAQMTEVEGAFDSAIQPIIAARYNGAGNPLTDLFRQFHTAFGAVGDDLAAAISEEPGHVADATNACRGIRRGFSTTVAGLLGVTVILPIGDGD